MNTMHTNGFTLLEVMIALTILAVASAGLIAASSQSVRQAAMLEEKTMAVWIADNELTAWRTASGLPTPGTQRSQVSMARRVWNVQTRIDATAHPDMHAITVTVTNADATSRATLTGFVGRY